LRLKQTGEDVQPILRSKFQIEKTRIESFIFQRFQRAGAVRGFSGRVASRFDRDASRTANTWLVVDYKNTHEPTLIFR